MFVLVVLFLVELLRLLGLELGWSEMGGGYGRGGGVNLWGGAASDGGVVGRGRDVTLEDDWDSLVVGVGESAGEEWVGNPEEIGGVEVVGSNDGDMEVVEEPVLMCGWCDSLVYPGDRQEPLVSCLETHGRPCEYALHVGCYQEIVEVTTGECREHFLAGGCVCEHAVLYAELGALAADDELGVEFGEGFGVWEWAEDGMDEGFVDMETDGELEDEEDVGEVMGEDRGLEFVVNDWVGVLWDPDEFVGSDGEDVSSGCE